MLAETTRETVPRAAAAPVEGTITIAPQVVFSLALHTALSTYGIVGIASRYTGADCTHTDPRRGIEIVLRDRPEDDSKHVTVTLHVIAEYGVRIRAVTTSLQQQVKYAIERCTGYKVDAVHVHVAALRVSAPN
ncbi:MAG: Asp23/Gls24 family envelope stress response protein [Thermoflexales bacterium]|nr:Asp23/Gls24 family envelope stress response protein [Thermoflexales bacterium]MCS7324632.1 Asp23/Gls24 family envelope stress response protein [Thermoflexales bacterium]MCX7939865.1 Asp23/Gls24 family envelope stress response protein [Thermoflexales bacterium]MDW8053756.1 Asp23/Gls24 family envelope stress response protein [Anaerolineae bacterium]MDW8292988.1 Asp23/Gls24 family envelope stress response protein [Anaerolineae bacterium]